MVDETSIKDSISHILSSTNFKTPEFYNPKTSAFSYKITAQFKGVSICIPKTLNPNVSGRPKPGEKRFDREHAAMFTLDVGECCELLEAIPSLLKGTYNNPNEKNPKNKGKLIFTHFPPNENSQPSFLIVEPARDASGTIVGSLRISISPPKNSNYVYCGYSFRRVELIRFRFFLNAVCNYLDFTSCVYEANKNTTKMAIYESKSKEGNKGTQNYQSNNNNYKNQNYNTQVDQPLDMGFDNNSTEPISDESIPSNDDVPFFDSNPSETNFFND